MSALVEVACVPPDKVELVWPRVSGLIFIAMKRGDLAAFHPVEQNVLSGVAQLWLMVEDRNNILAACVTELHATEWRKVCVIVACGGKDMDRWIELIEEIEKFAKAEGCSRVRIVGRKGWERVLPNYRTRRIVLDKDL
jgi:hypothetical protein